jgi:acyl-CoA dehydrogenase
MTQDLFADAMAQLLRIHCTPGQVRRIERDADASALWRELNDSGFLDALADEAHGGAGLSLPDIFSTIFVAGRHAVPAPLAQTLLVRGTLGADAPQGPIAIAQIGGITPAGELLYERVSFGRVAQWVLVETETQTLLLPAARAQVTAAGGHGSLDADLRWAAIPDEAITVDVTNWMAPAACATAALMAGAMERVFEITVDYANERKQFGKPIGKQQAIQQQLSVMAEHVFSARMAAQIGFDSTSSQPAPLRAAIAKERTSAVVPEVCAIAHAVHGAMGFTEEYDLQLFTRRLHEWRMAYGAETFWRERLGTAVLQSGRMHSLDIVREVIMAH